MFCRPLVAPFHECANGGRGGVENRHTMTLADVPEPIALRPVGRALVHHAGGAVGERTVDEIRMSRHPANIRGAPEDIIVLQIEHRPGGGGDAGEIAAGGVHDSFRLARSARCVEDVEDIFGIHWFRLAPVGCVLHQVVPPEIAAGVHRRTRRLGVALARGRGPARHVHHTCAR